MQYVALSVLMVIERATCPRTFVLFSCSCGSRGGESGGLQRRVAGAEAARNAVEVLAGDTPSSGLAVVLPLSLAGVRVLDLVGDDDAHVVVAVVADDLHRGASRDDGVALVGADVADADAGCEVATTTAVATGVAVTLGDAPAGGGDQRDGAGQTGGGDASAGGITKSAHEFSLVVDERFVRVHILTRASDHILLHNLHSVYYIVKYRAVF